jgi:hypothetical protein
MDITCPIHLTSVLVVVLIQTFGWQSAELYYSTILLLKSH